MTMPRWCSVVAPAAGSTRCETLVGWETVTGAPSAGAAAPAPIRAVAATAARLPVVRVLVRMAVMLLGRCEWVIDRDTPGERGRLHGRQRRPERSGPPGRCAPRRALHRSLHRLGDTRHVEV